jgi:hypothetical protein
VEAIVSVDFVSVDEFEAVLVGVELLLVGELLLVVEVLLPAVGELVAEL